jgi:hypothetical protein
VIWLGSESGYLTDWVTQQWVRASGRRVLLSEHSWLDGPIGNTRIIGRGFFEGYAREHGFEIIEDAHCGLMNNFSALFEDSNTPGVVAPAVRDFYEHTSAYTLDAWSEWHGFFKPFGWVLAVLFSRRLQQLNIPLSSLDSSKGMTSSVLQMWDRQKGQLVQTAWVRELHATRNVLYAGSYSICRIPGYAKPCVKVVFPLPNGNAIVVMKPECHVDGSISLTSAGNGFGDPGFYFTVHGRDGKTWARYVRAMQEKITVYPAEPNAPRADHVLWFWRMPFLRLHYRMVQKPV